MITTLVDTLEKKRGQARHLPEAEAEAEAEALLEALANTLAEIKADNFLRDSE